MVGPLGIHRYRIALGLCLAMSSVLYRSNALSALGSIVTGDSNYDLSDPVPTDVRVHWIVGAPDPVTGAVPQAHSPFYGHGGPLHWEVVLGSGRFIDHQTDFYLPGAVPINLTRTYRPMDDSPLSFGRGTSDSYEISVELGAPARVFMDLVLPDATRIHYRRISASTDLTGAVYLNGATPGPFFGSTISRRGQGWDLRTANGTVLGFRDSPASDYRGCAALVSITSVRGETLAIKRDRLGNKLRVTSPEGGTLLFRHDRLNRIIEVRDNEGQVAAYTYDRSGRLAAVTDIAGGISRYSYDTAGGIVAITDPAGRRWMKITYDQRHRVVAQDILTGRHSRRYFYSLGADGGVAAADIIFADGSREHHRLDSDGCEVLPADDPPASRLVDL